MDREAPMINYPQDAKERDAVRDRIGHAAYHRAISMRSSIKCAGVNAAVQHANERDGCQNTGATCLCRCHDA
jgi:hypothetical protein